MNLIIFAINGLWERKGKNLFIYVILTILTALVLSVFTIGGAIHKELNSTLNSLPDIIVQKTASDKQRDIPVERAYEIIEIPGVENVFPRVWGYYYFDFSETNFTILGLNNFEKSYKTSLNRIIEQFDDKFKPDSIILGEEVYKLFKKIGYDKTVYFRKTDGKYLKFNILGKFKFPTYLESSDTIVMSDDRARQLLDVDEDYATDIVVKVSNPNEVITISTKIKKMFPDVRIITKNDIITSYQNIFDFKKGFFVTVFIIVIITFFIIVYDKLSGFTGEEKKEIGILRAIGWKIPDIIKIKIYESFIISLLSYFTGILITYFYVYTLKAPFISGIFAGYSKLRPEFILPFYFNFQDLITVFLLTAVIYISATIIPAWKIATLDIEDIIR